MDNVVDECRLYLQASVAPSTLRTYTSALNNYQSFCLSTNFLIFPLRQNVLQLYVTVSARRLAYSTIKVYLAGIQFHSFTSGYTDTISDMIQLYYTMRGIRRIQGNSRTRTRRLPITVLHIHTLLTYIQTSEFIWHDQLMLSSAVTLAFFWSTPLS